MGHAALQARRRHRGHVVRAGRDELRRGAGRGHRVQEAGRRVGNVRDCALPPNICWVIGFELVEK